MIEKITITALFVIALWVTFLPNMIFSFVPKGLSTLNDKIKKPLFACCICMTPWWGSLVYWTVWGNSWQEWLMTVFGAMGFNTIFVKLMPE